MKIINSGLKTKILLIYVSLILIPFTLMFIVFSLKSMNEMKTNYISFMKENNSQINLRINTLIGDIDRANYMQSFDLQVQRILGKTYNQTGMEYITDVRAMLNILASNSRVSSFNYEAVYVGRNNEYYTAYNQTPAIKNQIQSLITKARELKGKRYVSDILIGIDGSKYITVGRMLINSNTLKENGFMFISMRLNDIQNYFKKGFEKSNSNFVVLNNESIILNYELNKTESNKTEANKTESKNNDSIILNTINTNWKSMENKSMVLTIGENKFQVVGITSDITGWKIVQYQPISVINKYVINSALFYFVTMIPALLLFIVLGYFLSSRILHPIEALKQAMKKVKNGDFVKVKDENFNKADEMGSLITSYNSMVVQLEESINQNYKAKLNQKRIEFKMLEAQINPHFLYNTLNLISSISELEGIDEISIITNSLSDMFRYNIKKGSIVSVKEELNQIINYVNIQKYRFLGKIEFQCDIIPEVENYRVLKFLLQPLIENALYHGIEQKEGVCHLHLSFKEENSVLCIYIDDDGVGMTYDVLEGINEKLHNIEEYTKQDEFEHIGIENVNSRIKHYYGAEYGLHVWSKVNVGTRITITIPVVKEV